MLVKNEKQLLENAKTSELRRARSILIEMVNKAIASADSSPAMRRRLKIEDAVLGLRQEHLTSVRARW
jgi:hypothetical protein